MPDTATIQHWNPVAREWETRTVEIPPAPRRRTRGRRIPGHRQGAPRNLAGLSNDAPVPAWWRDTAFAPREPLADMRSYLPAATLHTHRPAVPMPADPGRITETGRRA